MPGPPRKTAAIMLILLLAVSAVSISLYVPREAVRAPSAFGGSLSQLSVASHTYAVGDNVAMSVSYDVKSESLADTFISGKIQTPEQYGTDENIATLFYRPVPSREGSLSWSWNQRNGNNEPVPSGKYYVKTTLTQKLDGGSESTLDEQSWAFQVFDIGGRRASTIAGSVAVGFREITAGSQSAESIITQNGGTVASTDNVLNFAWVNVQENHEDAFITAVLQAPEVEYAQQETSIRLSYTPTDPDYSQQWGHQKINLPDAWDNTFGANIIVAVIDTGIEDNHPDLDNSLWYDEDGYWGWDFYHNDSYPEHDSAEYSTDHGTHVAGIIAAEMDNENGGTGVAPQAEIMALKVFDNWYLRSIDNANYVEHRSKGLHTAIRYAADHGAKIINMSLGGGYNRWMDSACTYAYNEGVLIVAAAGNESSPSVSYPAKFEEVVAVSAINENDVKTGFSNWGAEIEIAAPGDNIYSTVSSERYDSWSGTSMAASYVSGVAALVWSAHPSLSNEQVRIALRMGVVDLGPSGRDENYGFGRIDASLALEAAENIVAGTLDLPDLIVENVTPLEATAHQMRNYAIIVRNTGEYSSDSAKLWVYFDNWLGGGVSVGALAPGSQEVYEVSWTFGTAGTRAIRTVVDVDNDVHEADEANNENTFTVEVGSAEEGLAPDLVIAGITPTRATTDAPTPYWITVNNQGTAKSTRSYVDVFYDGSATSGACIEVYSLGPGENFEAVVTQTFGAGTHTIRAVTDSLSQVDELDETNNENTVQVEVGNFKPDLVATSVEPLSTLTDNDTVYSITVKNQGTAQVTAWADFFGIMVYYDNSLEGVFVFPEMLLGIGEEYTCEVAKSFDAGEHLVRVVIDPGNIVDESDETNNENTFTVTASEPRPDLVVDNVGVDNENLLYWIDIKNQGFANNSENFDVSVQFDNLDPDNFEMGELEIGETRTETRSWSPYENTENIYAVADVHNTIAEMDETNNTRESLVSG